MTMTTTHKFPLQVAVELLVSTYNVGLVALKQNAENALNLFPDAKVREKVCPEKLLFTVL